MPIRVSHLRRILEGKLGFQKSEGGRHERYTLIIDGVIVAQTYVSRGDGFDIGDDLLRRMAGQLSVPLGIYKRAIDCTLSGPDFRETVRQNSA